MGWSSQVQRPVWRPGFKVGVGTGSGVRGQEGRLGYKGQRSRGHTGDSGQIQVTKPTRSGRRSKDGEESSQRLETGGQEDRRTRLVRTKTQQEGLRTQKNRTQVEHSSHQQRQQRGTKRGSEVKHHSEEHETFTIKQEV